MLRKAGLTDAQLEPANKVNIRFLITNVSKGGNTPRKLQDLKEEILGHYCEQQAERAKLDTWLNVHQVVHTNAIVIVFSQELVDKIKTDPIIFHASGTYRAYLYEPVEVCKTCCAIGTHECSGNPICGECAGDHLTSACTEQLIKKCANCSGNEQFSMLSNHSVRNPFCPTVLATICRS